MKHFIDDSTGKLYGYNSVEEMKKFSKVAGLRELSAEEFYEIQNPPLTPEQVQEKMVNEATAVVDGMIQSVIDDYNAKHNLVFENVDSLAKYTMNPQYTHWQFCNDVLAWVTSEVVGVGIWETARDIQNKVISGELEAPDTEAFIAMLPAYSGYTGEPEVI